MLVLHDTLKPVTIATFADKAIDVPHGSVKDGENLQQWDRNGSPAQLWYVDPCGENGVVRIINKGSGRVLDVREGRQPGELTQYSWAANDNQRWQLEEVGDGLVVVKLAINTNMVLDVEGGRSDNSAKILLWSRNNQVNQHFRLVP